MNSNQKLLVRALKGENTKRPPFWFMRQAGRYLPEYRQLRGKAKNFLDFCYTPALACEATLQPIRRFGMDGAILFSDILVIPHALGAEVWFEEGSGPRLTPVDTEAALESLSRENQDNRLAPVYEALEKTRWALPDETALIGFAGAPWTLACYTVQGKSDKEFGIVRAQAASNKPFFSKLISLFSDAVAQHAILQIEAGAEVIQLFDSWAGVLNDQEFTDWVITPTKYIVAKIKSAHPEVPIIGFPREAGNNYTRYAKETGIDAISIDQSVSMEQAKELQSICTVQGNLDPAIFAGDKNKTLAEAKRIMSALGDKAFVFNLGHGILPHTPIENVQALCQFLKHP